MKLFAIAITTFVALPSVNAMPIRLACCKRENACPTNRKNMGMGGDGALFQVCCVDGASSDEAEVQVMHTCLEDFKNEGGPSTMMMSVLEPAVATTSEVVTMSEVATTAEAEVTTMSEVTTTAEAEGATTSAAEVTTVPAKDQSITLMSVPDPTEVTTSEVVTMSAVVTTAEAELTTTSEVTTTAEAEVATTSEAEVTSVSANDCCRAISAAQPARLRSGPPIKNPMGSICPENTFSIDGALYMEGNVNYQVCCNTDGRQASEFSVVTGLSMCQSVSADTPVPSNDIVNLVETANATTTESSDDTAVQQDPSVAESNTNSANAMKNAGILGMAVVGAALQALL